MKYEKIDTLEEYQLMRDGIMESWDEKTRHYYKQLKEQFNYCDNLYQEANRKKEDDKQIRFAKFKMHEALDKLIEFEKNHDVYYLAKSFAHTQSKKFDRMLNQFF